MTAVWSDPDAEWVDPQVTWPGGGHPHPRWGVDDAGQTWLGGYRLLVGPRAEQIGCPWPETYGWWECGPPLDLPAGITEEPWPVPPFGSMWSLLR